MYSQTFIGREIFASIWGLGVLGATARELAALRFPFDTQLRDFVSEHDAHFSELWESVRGFSCLSEDVMKIGIDEAPWTGATLKYPNSDALRMELVISSQTPERFVGKTDFQQLTINEDSIREGALGNLARLLSALLSAHWAFCSDVRSGLESPDALTRKLDALFRRLVPIIRTIKLPPGPLLAIAYRAWKPHVTQGAVHAEVPDFAAYVESWIAYMDRTHAYEG